MNIKSINWLISCPPDIDRTAAFLEGALDLQRSAEGVPESDPSLTRFIQYRLDNGDMVELVAGDDAARQLLAKPVMQFEVDDVVAARKEMEAKGVEFVGPIHRHGDEGWTFFKSPDGDVYCLGGKAGID